jgi:hypothetical protein
MRSLLLGSPKKIVGWGGSVFSTHRTYWNVAVVKPLYGANCFERLGENVRIILKTILMDLICEVVWSVHVAGVGQWRAVVNTEINIRYIERAWNLLSSWAPAKFSLSTMLRLRSLLVIRRRKQLVSLVYCCVGHFKADRTLFRHHADCTTAALVSTNSRLEHRRCLLCDCYCERGKQA